MKRAMIAMAAFGLMIAIGAPLASAHPMPVRPSVQDAAKEEADAYKAWWEANQAKDVVKAMPLAKAYLMKFPSGQYATYLKGWVVQARGYLFNQARQAKNIAEEVRIGKEALAEDPQNFDYLYLLAIDLRVGEVSANPPNSTHQAETVDFTQRTIQLIEAGKMPTGMTADKWNKNQQLAYFYHTLAILDQKDKRTDSALAHYKKASELEPNNANFFLQCGLLNYEKYGEASKKFETFSAEERSKPEEKPEVKAALDDVNAKADTVIDCWARFLGLTAKEAQKWGATREQVLTAVTALYKFRHNDSTDGLQQMIDKHSNGTPAN